MRENISGNLPRNKCYSRYILSYGAGVDSTALLFLLIKNKVPLDYVVFADTGSELPETYDYIDTIKQYLAQLHVPFKIVRTRGGKSLHDKCEERKVIPSQVWRWCTRDFKVSPIYRFYRSLNSYIYQYIGIDYDEFYRIKDSTASYVENIYPLIENKIGRDQCIKIIKNAGFPVPSKSGCYFCPFNNRDRWIHIFRNYPTLFNEAMQLEENGKHMPKQKLTPTTLRVLKKLIIKNTLPVYRTESPCGTECML